MENNLKLNDDQIVCVFSRNSGETIYISHQKDGSFTIKCKNLEVKVIEDGSLEVLEGDVFLETT